jgi:hypothetical protein
MADSRSQHIPWRVPTVPETIHRGGGAVLCAGVWQALWAIEAQSAEPRLRQSSRRETINISAQNISTNLLPALA